MNILYNTFKIRMYQRTFKVGKST